MPGSKVEIRSKALSIRCYKLRQEGFTLSEIAAIVDIPKESVYKRIQLGGRLLSLEESK